MLIWQRAVKKLSGKQADYHLIFDTFMLNTVPYQEDIIPFEVVTPLRRHKVAK